jgi:Flp pilus assembly protein TadD
VALLNTQQYDAAREQLEKAVALNPNDAHAHFELAHALRSLGKEDEAQAQFRLYQQRAQAEVQRALAANKSSQADKALKSGDTKSAVSLYREAVAARPDDPILEYNLAHALGLAGEENAERAALEAAIQLRPGFPEAENRLGYLSARAGNAAAAEQHFRKALASAPSYADAANNLGTLLGKQGRDQEAETFFRSAVASNPRYAPAWVNLAATLASESRFSEARSAVEAALRVDPKDADALQLRRMLPKSSPPDPASGSPNRGGNTAGPQPEKP